MVTSRSILIECATETCTNALVIPWDSAWPKAWTCPLCEDRVLEQQVIAMSEERPNAPGLDRPIRKFADF
jgi:hypothetical protein